jgi:hypothetical protein
MCILENLSQQPLASAVPIEPAPRELSLRLFNPSPYLRGGIITTPWQPIADAMKLTRTKEFILTDWQGSTLPAQVDVVDPADPSRGVLIFELAAPLPPGSEHYTESSRSIILRLTDPCGEPSSGPRDKPTEDGGLRLDNGRLVATFHLGGDSKWFAGSATSVSLDGVEVLDLWLGGIHPEKRGLQVDRVRLARPHWEDREPQEVELATRSYRLISRHRGPLRESLTLASEPFPFLCTNPWTGQESTLTCVLYRVISLYAGADYLLEELYVKAAGEGAIKPVHPSFSLRYFTHMDMSHNPKIFRYANVPDWFAVGYNEFPYPGYGFATDVHTSEVSNPHPSYPIGDPHKTFSWEILPARQARCVHLFMAGVPQDFEHRAGHLWYEMIYKPLLAKI